MTSLPPPTPCGASRADEREPRRVVSPTSDGRPDRPNCHAGAHKMREQYLEDFAVGQIFGSGRLRIEAERIKSFAAEFDPQPFHLDEDSARSSVFQGLAASGWRSSSRARSSPPAALSAPASTSSAGRGRSARGRVSAGERSAGRAAVEVAAGTGMDQGPDDHAGPERRRRAGPDREPGGAAPAGLGAESPRHVVRGEFHDTDSGR
jgi:hypothetical protein